MREKRLAEVLQKKNGFAEFHNFMKKERQTNSSKTLLNQWEPMCFCKLQTKKCEEISTTKLKHVSYLYSSSINPQEARTKQRNGEN